MGQKILMIVAYYGKLPLYFPAWLKSVDGLKHGKFDFLLFTDQDVTDVLLPPNLKVVKNSLDDFRATVKEKLKVPVSIKRAYRICNFKPMYGVLFSEYTKGYSFWGHTDLDVVYGNLDKYINDELLENNDVIFNAGHCTVFRNNESINNLFRCEGSVFDWKTVVGKDAAFAFDEVCGMYRIAESNQIKAHFGLPIVDADPKHAQLRNRMESNNPEHQVFYWENGSVFRVKLDGTGGGIRKLLISIFPRKSCLLTA